MNIEVFNQKDEYIGTFEIILDSFKTFSNSDVFSFTINVNSIFLISFSDL